MVCLQVTDDRYHPIARETLPVLLDVSRALVTSNLVVGETCRIPVDFRLLT